jgi:hypothetical protein
MTDIDWANPAEAALALGRVVNAWRAHLARAASSRERAAALRSAGSPPPAGVSEADWRGFPALLDAQGAEWDSAAADDASEFREAAARAVAGGRLTRGQASQLTAAATVGDAEAAVAALKRDLF